jgi:RNA polymerase sigma-70 factor, ECF subfamily
MTGMAQQDDREIVARCQQGDQGAMQVLFERHNKKIYAMALRMTGSGADAEDVVQDTFIKAFRYLPKFRGDSAVGTWLYRIAVNLTRDLHKRRQRSRPEPEMDPGEHVEPRDTLAAKELERALQELPEGYREVLVLHDVMEKDHKEIASILDVKVGTSKSQLHKARARMRELLTSPQGAS